jgi:2'-5' RNA ligase
MRRRNGPFQPEHLGSFLASHRTIANRHGDFSDWHQGRARYGLWAIEVSDASWVRNVHAASAHLREFLLPEYERFPHITVHTFGFVTGPGFSQRSLEGPVERLKKASPSPFSLSLGRLSSFLSAPYFEIGDSKGVLPELRALLSQGNRDDGSEPYVPHLTVGLYASEFPTRDVAEILCSFVPEPTDPLMVNKVCFVTYETGAIAGPLSVLYEFDLCRASNETGPREAGNEIP